MERRRRHEECGGTERGCEVVEGAGCPVGRRWGKWEGLRRVWVKLRKEVEGEWFAGFLLGFAMLVGIQCFMWINLYLGSHSGEL